ncbi:transposase [Arthrospira sp. PCC 8006]|uniref:transposase n=1 Tax=Arthrospira sp. PCC 8006 TaxID=1982224 RepID=UPI00396D18CF
MSRPTRNFQPGHCHHVTVRCNNREFKLTRTECRKVLLYTIKRVLEKYRFRLYGVCIMSNHVHYLIEPLHPEDLPKIMHGLNWYAAMCFNRMLNRTGHFWEKRYHSSAFPNTDKQRALNTLRYIHANPKAARMQQGFFYDFSNYGSYDRLTDDGLTQWHPAFLALGNTLDECARKYRGFCKKYKPNPKQEKRYHWGSKFLPKVIKGSGKKPSPGQMKLPWNIPDPENTEVTEVAEKFVQANGYRPEWEVPGIE